MTTSKIDETVLSAVNAPYKNAISARTLAACLSRGSVGAWPAHIATFFTDLEVADATAFADAHGVAQDRLIAAYGEMKEKTGECNPDFEALFPAPAMA